MISGSRRRGTTVKQEVISGAELADNELAVFTGHGDGNSRRRDCHFANTPSPSLLKRPLKGLGVQQNDSLSCRRLDGKLEPPANVDPNVDPATPSGVLALEALEREVNGKIHSGWCCAKRPPPVSARIVGVTFKGAHARDAVAAGSPALRADRSFVLAAVRQDGRISMQLLVLPIVHPSRACCFPR